MSLNILEPPSARSSSSFTWEQGFAKELNGAKLGGDMVAG